VRVRGRVAELLVVALAPADAVVLLLRRHRRKPVQVVDPLLYGDETRTAVPGRLSLTIAVSTAFLPLGFSVPSS